MLEISMKQYGEKNGFTHKKSKTVVDSACFHASRDILYSTVIGHYY